MKKILNPYDRQMNMCFGCSEINPIGLHLKFTESNEYLLATWTPLETYQGYPNILHGGIIAALLDEIGGWCVSVKIGTAGVTSDMTTKYLYPVYLSKGDISLKAKIDEQSGKIAKISCELFDGQSKLCAEAVVNYFIYPLEIAKSRFKYPGQEAFYGKENL
jgi:uncharacterized protein (TIGR00369 family)